MILQGFVGPTDTLLSPNVNAEETINFFPEPGTPGTPKVPAWLCPTPGVAPFVVLPDGPIRAEFAQDGRMFAVGGTGFYEIFSTQTFTFRDFVRLDEHPATISSNGTAGNQLFVTSGGYGFIYDLLANTLSIITDPFFLLPSAMGVFADGYFVNLHAGTRQFQISALEDGTSWDPTDVFEVSQSSDNLVAMAWNHRELWLMGSRTTEVWANIGDPLNPFQPIPGAFLHQGIVGPFAFASLDNTLYWITENVDGSRMVVRANGYTPERVSNHAIEFRLSQYERLDDAICWTYQENGHSFLMIFPPTPPVGYEHNWFTWVFDASTGMWHQRALWDPTMISWVPHIGRCHAYGFGRHLVGDRRGSAIYDMSLNYFTDTIVTV